MTDAPRASELSPRRPLRRRWWVWWLGSMAVLLVLGSISFRPGSTNDTSATAEASALVIEAPTGAPSEVVGTVAKPVCVPASRAALDAVLKARVGSDVTMQRGFVVELVGEHVTGAPAFILAAKLTRPGAPDQLGTWGMGTADGGAPLWALNKTAQDLTSWLASAETGSADDRMRNSLAASNEAVVAFGCAAL